MSTYTDRLLTTVTWADGVLSFGMFFVWCWQPDAARLDGEDFTYDLDIQLQGTHEKLYLDISPGLRDPKYPVPFLVPALKPVS